MINTVLSLWTDRWLRKTVLAFPMQTCDNFLVLYGVMRHEQFISVVAVACIIVNGLNNELRGNICKSAISVL